MWWPWHGSHLGWGIRCGGHLGRGLQAWRPWWDETLESQLWRDETLEDQLRHDAECGFFLTIHTQHLGLDWDLDSSRRLRYPGCSLSQFLFLSHPKASWPGWGHWSAHFKQLEILNPLSPRQSRLIWISCDYCNSSYKTPDSSNLPSPWPNSSHLPRGAGRPAVLFHGGWHSTLSLWRFQHSPRQALC